MEGYWGMGRTVAPHGVTHRVGIGGGVDRAVTTTTSASCSRATWASIETNLGELLDRAEALLHENRAEVLRMAHALEVHKTIDGEDVVAVIEGSEGPLIDGRAYCDDEFVEAMENLNGGRRRCPRAHETVAVLPATNGQHPVDAARGLRHSAGLTPAPLTPRRCGGRPGRRRAPCRRAPCRRAAAAGQHAGCQLKVTFSMAPGGTVTRAGPQRAQRGSDPSASST